MSAALEVYRQCVAYLVASGWYRDGDDPGVWRDSTTGIDAPGYSFSDALARELAYRGINFQWTT